MRLTIAHLCDALPDILLLRPMALHWQTFLAELKRRKVFRVAAVYGATGFVVLQVADLVFPRIGLPDWTVTLVVALLLAGFPLALGVAWVFETGPDGLRRTERAAPGEIQAIIAQPRARRWRAGLAALVGVLLLGTSASWTLGLMRNPSTRSYESIAVLPFATSGNPEDEYFGDGLAEELANALSSIEGLDVAARTSAFSFKGTSTDIRTIGDSLNVETVLEGSMRRSAGRIRINAQLVDAHTGYRLWSEQYDRPLTDLFDVQDAIAAEIVDALAIRLSGAEKEGLYRGGTSDVEAYELYLLGRQKWATRQLPLLREAVAHFEQAIARDSSFALAWSGFADAIDALAFRSPEARHRVSEAKYAAQRALVLDPELAEAWASLGVLVRDFDRDHRFAELALERAIRLKPSYAPAHLWLSGQHRRSGRLTEALELSRRAVQLDPIGGQMLATHAETLSALGRWPEARELHLQLRSLGWSDPVWAAQLVSNARWLAFNADEVEAYARDWATFAGYSHPDEAVVVGRAMFEPELRDEARAVLERMDAQGVRTLTLAQLFMALGDREKVIALLQRILEQDDPGIVDLGPRPVFAPLRSDPRFVRILTELKLPVDQSTPDSTALRARTDRR